MDMELRGSCDKSVGMSRNRTLTERLEARKQDLESHLKEVDEALDALKENPELQKLIDIVTSVRA